MSEKDRARPIGGLISDVQQGVIGQNEFAKLVMIGTGGGMELAAPLTDEERRDFEVHVRGKIGSALAFQVKTALELANLGGDARYLRIRFSVLARRLVNDPLFQYFLAYLNPATMRFQDPLFVIPSEEFHRHANPRKVGDKWDFTFEGSMEPESNDRWVPFRVGQLELGKKLMSISNELSRLSAVSADAMRLLDLPGLVWARQI